MTSRRLNWFHSRTLTCSASPTLWMTVAVCGLVGCKTPDSESKDQSKQTSPVATAQADAPEQIKSLPQVDLSSFDSGSKEMWAELANELLSPCGEPVSVARCVAEARKCRACVPAAKYIARLVDEGFQRDEIRELHRVRYDKTTKVSIKDDGSPSRGATMAPVTIYEFSDFQCPHCKLAAPQLKAIVEAMDGKVRLVFKQFPLSGHPRARDAAIATVAASQQGKFWEMHDEIFANQERLEPADIQKYAKKIGLDMAKFNAARGSKKVIAKVEADKAQGVKAGVESTPSIFVNDRRFELSLDSLKDYLDEELEK